MNALLRRLTRLGLSALQKIRSRRQVNEALRERARRFDLIANAGPDGIVVIDAGGLIVDANLTQARLHRYDSPADLVGLPASHLVAPSSRDAASSAMKRRLNGEDVPPTEYELLRADGTTFYGETLATLLRDADGTVSGYIGVTRDTTRRHHAEEALRESESRYKSLFEDNRTPMLVIDPETTAIVDANPAASATYGWSRGELLAMSLEQILAAPTDQTRPLMELARTGVQRDFISKHRRADGSILQVGVRSGPLVIGGKTYLVSAYHDISDLKQTEQALRASEERARSAVERLQMVNQIGVMLTSHLDLDSLMQTMYDQCQRIGDVGTFYVALYDDETDMLSFPFFRKDGEPRAIAPRHVHENPGVTTHVIRQRRELYIPDLLDPPPGVEPVRLPGPMARSFVGIPLILAGRIVGVVSMQSYEPDAYTPDQIDTLKLLSVQVAIAIQNSRLYQSLEDAYNELRETQRATMKHDRLRALGEMASGIAHDINNAISPIVLYAGLIARSGTLDDRSQAYLATIVTAIHDVESTVARLRQFYRDRDQDELLPVDINSAVRQAIELTRPRWRDVPQAQGVTIDLQLGLTEDLGAVLGDEGGIRQAAINLILNAVDAMPEGGTLAVRTYSQVDPLGHVVLEVIDSGLGMDEETRGRIFEPFFTTKGVRGSGLGLASVYGTMRRHGGDVQLVSQPGAGTAVRLIFPAGRIEEQAQAPSLPQRPPHPLLILFVDDEPVLRDVMREALEGEGHIVTVADGGQSGLDAFQKASDRGEPFDVVITDLGMPHVDGRKVARSVKDVAPGTPVIMMTGWGQQLRTEGAIPDHVDMMLAKPPTIEDLNQALARVMRMG